MHSHLSKALNMRMVALLMWSVATALFACSQGEEIHCRCTNPNAACWPTSEQWNAFNESINGRLIAPMPTGSPCHDPHFNATKCQAILANQANAYMRAANPGSMQNENWEESEDGTRVITCSMHAPRTTHCHQGRVPALGVRVEAVQDVQRAIRFATQHNLRVAVKTSGHDYMGRSTAAGALLIWMHKLRRLSIHEVWTGTCGGRVHSAITVMGGVSWREVYERVNSTNWVVVGGSALTVGAAGGYVQGGGHGALSPSFGLAVDNVLEMEVVTADGALRVASACQEPDLFFALRGGGGGTFGVVTSVTYKLHKRPESFLATHLQLIPPQGEAWRSAIQEEILTAWSRATISLDAANWAGYWYFSSSEFSGDFVVPGGETEAFTSIVETLAQIENVTVFMRTSTFSTFLEWHSALYDRVYPGTSTDYTGAHLLLGSRIIPFAALASPRRLARTIVALGTGVLAHMVIGPGVRSGDPGKHTSVTPAWRAGVWHLTSPAAWAWNATDQAGEARVQTERFSELLQDAFPRSGAYLNEACAEERGWAESFWGENYARLMATKVRVDPRGLFVCRQCVGSELWSEDGNCRQEAL